jgi:hypothetical protein
MKTLLKDDISRTRTEHNLPHEITLKPILYKGKHVLVPVSRTVYNQLTYTNVFLMNYAELNLINDISLAIKIELAHKKNLMIFSYEIK